MKTFLNAAQAIKSEIIDNRRALHQLAEVGFELPHTHAYVVQKLVEYGYTPQVVGQTGIVCTVGHLHAGGKTILLRADMDALPMQELSGLAFASQTGNAHTCGHDAHTAMLLGAAKLLKEQETDLTGCVKFMFQPAEEILAGANAMIKEGVLDNPPVDAAMALHIVTGIDAADTGVIYYKPGPLTYSGDAIAITIQGKDAHGSTPHLGIDAINIAAHITIALQNIVAKEVDHSEYAVVLVGRIQGGTAVNTVAGSAELSVSMRATTQATREFLKKRITEISKSIALTYGGTANVEHLYGMPPLINDEKLCLALKDHCAHLLGTDQVQFMGKFNGSEDFCMIAEKVPAVLLTIGVGSLKENYPYALHHPEMRINEDALPIGAATLAHCATHWLKS